MDPAGLMRVRALSPLFYHQDPWYIYSDEEGWILAKQPRGSLPFINFAKKDRIMMKQRAQIGCVRAIYYVLYI